MVEDSPEEPRNPPETRGGWERVREIYQRNDLGEFSQEAEFMGKSAVTGMMVGMVYGGVPAARFSREQYIKQHQAEVYQHRVEAVRSAHNAALRGFIRYGFRWGWRIAAFVTAFNVVSSGLSAYQDEVLMSHFAAAGAVAGGLFRINLGLRGLIGGSVIGGVLGVPIGAMVLGLQAIAGEDYREHRRKDRQQLQDNWTAHLHLTETILHGMEQADTESAESQMEKISELLQQPRNPETTPEE